MTPPDDSVVGLQRGRRGGGRGRGSGDRWPDNAELEASLAVGQSGAQHALCVRELDAVERVLVDAHDAIGDADARVSTDATARLDAMHEHAGA